jgi:hypothetical protein
MRCRPTVVGRTALCVGTGAPQESDHALGPSFMIVNGLPRFNPHASNLRLAPRLYSGKNAEKAS